MPRVVPCFPLLGLTPSGLFMGLSSTVIYTSELIVCSTIYVINALLYIMITITVSFAVTYIVIKPSDSMQHPLGSSCTQGVHMASRLFKHEMAK